uniref:Uncharacterized protein n=1 Tax=Fagus sylvatica TaxID=28930 RepID=A0A2N9GA06_FAGSY
MLQCSGLLHRRQIDGHGAEFGFVVAVGVGVGWMFEFGVAVGLMLGLVSLAWVVVGVNRWLWG